MTWPGNKSLQHIMNIYIRNVVMHSVWAQHFQHWDMPSSWKFEALSFEFQAYKQQKHTFSYSQSFVKVFLLGSLICYTTGIAGPWTR